jgi:hypothetical protein
MLQVTFKYKTKKPFTDVYEGQTFMLDELSFKASMSDKGCWSRLEIPIPGSGDVLFRYVETGGNWMQNLLQRRGMLSRALEEFFGAPPEELDEYFLLVEEQHIRDGKVVFSV